MAKKAPKSLPLLTWQKMPPRCIACKIKHRGCDKKVPRCSACLRYGSECHYPKWNGYKNTNVPSASINNPKQGDSSECAESSASSNDSSSTIKSILVQFSQDNEPSEPLNHDTNDRTAKRPRIVVSESHAPCPTLVKREEAHPLYHTQSIPSLVIEEMKGSLPRLNSHFTRSVLIDSVLKCAIMYVFGGLGKGGKPSSDFHKLDMNSCEWTNLTNTVTQLNNPSTYNPFVNNSPKPTPLPPRVDATSQIYKTSDGAFLLIFGGSELSPDAPNYSISTNTLITVNLNASHLTWEFVPTTVDVKSEATDKSSNLAVTPRSAAGSFVHDRKFFVFGGYQTLIEVEGGNKDTWVWETVDSFSVLDLVSLKWIVCDQPYPLHVGSLGYYLDVYVPPCFGGNKVLICRSRLDDKKPINLASSDMFLFNTKSFTFGSLSHQVVGQVPSSLSSYDISPHRGPVSKSTFLLLGTLYDYPDSSEIWSFDILTDSWRNLKLSEELGMLQVQWQSLEHIPDNGWCLFGYHKPRPVKKATINAARQTSEQEPHPKMRKTWNVCVRIKPDDE